MGAHKLHMPEKASSQFLGVFFLLFGTLSGHRPACFPLGNRDLVPLYTPSIGLLFLQQQYPEWAGLIVPGFGQTHSKRQLWPKKKNPV